MRMTSGNGQMQMTRAKGPPPFREKGSAREFLLAPPLNIKQILVAATEKYLWGANEDCFKQTTNARCESAEERLRTAHARPLAGAPRALWHGPVRADRTQNRTRAKGRAGRQRRSQKGKAAHPKDARRTPPRNRCDANVLPLRAANSCTTLT